MFLPSRISNFVSESASAANKVDYERSEFNVNRVSSLEASAKSALLSPVQESSKTVTLGLAEVAVEVVRKTASLLKAQSWKCVHTFSRNSQAVAFSPDGTMLATGSTVIKLWDLQTGEVIHTIKRDSGILKSLAFSPDGKMLISTGLSQRIELWNTITGEQIREYVAHAYAVNALVFGADGKTFASGDRGKTVQIWNADEEHAAAT